MEAVTPFAQMPTTPEPIIAQVRRQLAGDARFGVQLSSGVLDRVADRAVRELWGSRIKTFVPVLALRQAREVLQDQAVGIMVERPEMHGVVHDPPAGPTSSERPPRDSLTIAGDVLPYDEQDVLAL